MPDEPGTSVGLKKPSRRKKPSPLARIAGALLAPIEFREVLLFAGLVLLGFGLWPVSPPAALIAPGAVLVGVAIFGTS